MHQKIKNSALKFHYDDKYFAGGDDCLEVLNSKLMKFQ